MAGCNRSTWFNDQGYRTILRIKSILQPSLELLGSRSASTTSKSLTSSHPGSLGSSALGEYPCKEAVGTGTSKHQGKSLLDLEQVDTPLVPCRLGIEIRLREYIGFRSARAIIAQLCLRLTCVCMASCSKTRVRAYAIYDPSFSFTSGVSMPPVRCAPGARCSVSCSSICAPLPMIIYRLTVQRFSSVLRPTSHLVHYF